MSAAPLIPNTDLITAIQEQVARTVATGGFAGLGAGQPLAATFCGYVEALLEELCEAFPENDAVAAYRLLYRSTIKGNPAREKWLMDTWAHEMQYDSEGYERTVNLYTAVRERDLDTLLAAGITILDGINAAEMYNDPELDADSREALCLHLDRICAHTQALSAAPQDMRDLISDTVRDIQADQGITPDTLTNIVQRTMAVITAPGGPEQMMGWVTEMSTQMGCGGEMVKAISKQFLAAGLGGGGAGDDDDESGGPAGSLNLEELMAQVQSELAGSTETLRADDGDGEEVADTAALSSLFSAMSPGK